MATKKAPSKKSAPPENGDNPDSLSIDYERSLKELETIVERMEAGEQTLETTIKDFERGIALSRGCMDSLKNAEQRIDKLLTIDATSDTDAVDAT